jgi:hypothetical protein
MTWTEVLEALEQGKWVRRAEWKLGHAVYLRKGYFGVSKTFYEWTCSQYHFRHFEDTIIENTLRDTLQDDWEVIENPDA